MKRRIAAGIAAIILSAAPVARADLLPPEDYNFTPGVTVVLEDGRAVVGAVVPEGPAAASGIFVGDYVLAVDRWDTTRLTDQLLDRALHGPEGSTIEVIVSDQQGFVTVHQLVRSVAD